MLDMLTLDQIRVFLAVVDNDSFSGAARHLHRVQSAVSYSIANLEQTLGLQLFDRSSRIPQITNEGKALLFEARAILSQIQHLREHARSMAAGIESEVSISIDFLFPTSVLVKLCKLFNQHYPQVNLKIYTEALGAVVSNVIEGVSSIGVAGYLALTSPNLNAKQISSITMLPVVSPKHPIAEFTESIPKSIIQESTQIVIMDRSPLTEGLDHGVITDRACRVTEIAMKHTFIKAGLGWGYLPRHLIQKDLEEGSLLTIQLEPWGSLEWKPSMYIFTHKDTSLGPAGKWLQKTLTLLASEFFATMDAPSNSETTAPKEKHLSKDER